MIQLRTLLNMYLNIGPKVSQHTYYFFYNKINFSFLNSFLLTEWADESVSRAEILRLIYQGRFLHGNVTLGGESNAILCHSNN